MIVSSAQIHKSNTVYKARVLNESKLKLESKITSLINLIGDIYFCSHLSGFVCMYKYHLLIIFWNISSQTNLCM